MEPSVRTLKRHERLGVGEQDKSGRAQTLVYAQRSSQLNSVKYSTRSCADIYVGEIGHYSR